MKKFFTIPKWLQYQLTISFATILESFANLMLSSEFNLESFLKSVVRYEFLSILILVSKKIKESQNI